VRERGRRIERPRLIVEPVLRRGGAAAQDERVEAVLGERRFGAALEHLEVGGVRR
jgi:hypothetical protein